jgi:hypothetical protein
LRRQLGGGIGRVDDDGGQAVAVERDRQRQADQAAAQDDDVRALHRASPKHRAEKWEPVFG